MEQETEIFTLIESASQWGGPTMVKKSAQFVGKKLYFSPNWAPPFSNFSSYCKANNQISADPRNPAGVRSARNGGPNLVSDPNMGREQ